MKKIFLMLLAVIFTVVLVSCDKEEGAEMTYLNAETGEMETYTISATTNKDDVAKSLDVMTELDSTFEVKGLSIVGNIKSIGSGIVDGSNVSINLDSSLDIRTDFSGFYAGFDASGSLTGSMAGQAMNLNAEAEGSLINEGSKVYAAFGYNISDFYSGEYKAYVDLEEAFELASGYMEGAEEGALPEEYESWFSDLQGSIGSIKTSLDFVEYFNVAVSNTTKNTIEYKLTVSSELLGLDTFDIPSNILFDVYVTIDLNCVMPTIVRIKQDYNFEGYHSTFDMNLGISYDEVVLPTLTEAEKAKYETNLLDFIPQE